MTVKCKVCGCEFPPIIDKHYVSRDCGKIGVTTVFSKEEERLYDTFDCPNCGCQVTAQERKRNYVQCDIPTVSEEDEEDE